MGLFDKLMSSGGGETPEDKKLFQFVRDKIEDSRKNGTRVSHEAIWLTNIAYLLGYDNLFFDPVSRRYRPTSASTPYLLRNRYHTNKILPTIQNRLARLTKSRPKFQIKPNSNDQDDKDAARLSEEVLDMIWHGQEMPSKQIDLYMWLQQCGHAYLKCSWDPTMGEPMVDPMSGELSYQGDIRLDVVSPFEVFPDPLAKTLNEAQWIIQAKVRKLDYFRAHYDRGEEVKEEDTWLLSAQYEGRINAINAAGNTQTSVNVNAKNTAIEIAYYERRSKKHPNGRMIIGANGIILEDKPLPCGEIPFCKFDDVVVSGKYYSESIITHLRPIQDQYNRLLNKRAQWINKMLAGKYITARGSELIQEALNDQSGEVVEYTPVPNAPPPTAMQVPIIPAHAYKEEESLQAQFNDLSGINEVSRGQSPGSGITAAIALQYLSEQDDTRIGIVSRRHELELAKFFRIVLLYVEEFYQTPRLLKIAGQNGQFLVKHFIGADIKGNTDVAVVEGSTLPGSITAKRDFILTIMGQGLLGNPQEPKVREKILKQLEFGDITGLWEDFAIDMNQVNESIDQIKNGIKPEISDLDNNEMHVYEKNKLRKTDQFKKMPIEAQALLMEDIESRIDLITRQNNPQIGEQEQQLGLMQHEAQMQSAADSLPNEEELLNQQLNNQQNLAEVENL